MYYVLWFIGLLAVCLLSVVTGLWFDRVNSKDDQ